ncbi:MAG: NAD(P)/FAD-dependent oxidoreductase [Gemmatimonadota bacterium]
MESSLADPRAHVVIVGGGFGGLFAARALRRAPVRVTLLDRNNHHLFQPLLYQVATASLSPSDIAQPIRSILRRQRNVRVLLAEATAVDLASRRVVLKDGELGYDFLILATGTRHAYFGRAEWEPLAPGLKSLDDAREIRQRFLLAFELAEREPAPDRRRPLLTFVIVGGGPTGVELAGTMSEFARKTIARDYRTFDPGEARVLLLEGGPRILSTYPEKLIRKAEASLADLGVEVRTNAVVTDVDERGVCVASERIESRCVLWAAGNVASRLARTLGVPLDRFGRVLVQPDLSLPGHPEAFVIGDMALFTDERGEALPGVAPVAMQQARRAAGNVERRLAGRPARPFRYSDRGSLATIGRAAAVADLRGLRLWGLPAWLAWLGIHIVFLIGFRNRLIVLIQWAWAYFTYQRGARLITCDAAFGAWPRGARLGGTTVEAGPAAHRLPPVERGPTLAESGPGRQGVPMAGSTAAPARSRDGAEDDGKREAVGGDGAAAPPVAGAEHVAQGS